MPAPLPAPNFDPAAAFPEVTPLRAALSGTDWQTVERIFAGRDAATVSRLLNVAADVPGTEDFLRWAVSQRPGDPLSATMLAARLVIVGWEIRSGRRANQVSQEQFDQFHAYLRQAETILIDVTARHPGYVPAWSWRVTTARGLQMGQSEARRRYDRLARHDPHHVLAQESLLQKLCPKWGGTWDAVHSFARDCMRAAPEGAQNAIVVLDGHLERAFELDTLEQAEQYLLGMEVWQEIQEAARRSVWHPAFRHDWGWVGTRSSFAMVFCLTGDWRSAATQFTVLANAGNVASVGMFDALGDASEVFQRLRAEAYAKGGAR
ncbi:hypothetical protein ACIBF5_24260 [Micromonospora sp. NPDC050417]|uniref:hypothetical protein n=1 Tax=Micromonospora sp. NPDC050417 TaxID=3364280 RepID=UPI003798D258